MKRAWFSGFFGVDHTGTIQPSRLFNGHKRWPHACPRDNSTLQPSFSAYLTAFSMCLSGSLGLDIHAILTRLLTLVNTLILANIRPLSRMLTHNNPEGIASSSPDI
jgi:hypothetical protein